MTNEETKEAVVEETEVKTEEPKSVEATGENNEQDTTGDGNNNESLTAVVVGGNNGGNDEVGELLYKAG